MTRDTLHATVARALEGRRLLEHPFYQRWEAGELSGAELAAYAEQYRVIEAALPHALEAIAAGLAEGEARDNVCANLHDERSVPMAHLELFETFAAAVGAKPGVAATEATAALVDLQLGQASTNSTRGLAVIAAYEAQAAAIASSKAEGLRSHYELDGSATTFWDVHATMEEAHAAWSLDALAALGASEDDVFTAAREGADAWWAFLDERESSAPALAAC
jgi:pyrroloquinoline-quinone synthase